MRITIKFTHGCSNRVKGAIVCMFLNFFCVSQNFALQLISAVLTVGWPLPFARENLERFNLSNTLVYCTCTVIIVAER